MYQIAICDDEKIFTDKLALPPYPICRTEKQSV